MRLQSALLFPIGTLLTAGGYGATFLLSMRFHEMGGSDLDTGAALAAATVGTFAGLAVVGWCARLLGAARLAALCALCIGAGVAGFALVGRAPYIDLPSGFLVGFGWGAFHLAAPMMLVERIAGAARTEWFFRSATFQMTGVGAAPAFAAYAMRASTGRSTTRSMRWARCACSARCCSKHSDACILGRPPPYAAAVGYANFARYRARALPRRSR